MPPTKINLRREFDTALVAYLEAIQDKKTALFAVVSQPSKQTEKKYASTVQEEKDARRRYRKATRKLHNVVRTAKS